jgi:hypothetical protein
LLHTLSALAGEGEDTGGNEQDRGFGDRLTSSSPEMLGLQMPEDVK